MNWDIVLSIVGIIAAFLIVRFLFKNFFTSRVLCLACCGAAIHQAFTASPDGILGCCILCILGWLFYRGENNFDFEYTGWVTYYSDGTEDHESIGGFFRHALTTIVVMGLIFYFLVPQWSALLWLIPGGILALDILSFGFFLLDR